MRLRGRFLDTMPVDFLCFSYYFVKGGASSVDLWLVKEVGATVKPFPARHLSSIDNLPPTWISARAREKDAGF